MKGLIDTAPSAPTIRGKTRNAPRLAASTFRPILGVSHGSDYELLPVNETMPLEYLGTISSAFVLREPKPFRCIYATKVFFIDVDFDAIDRNSALRLAHRFVAINPEYGLRVYETAAGLRHILTSHEFDACDGDAHVIMNELGADAKYISMCLRQRMFAARIDPKPARVTPGVQHAVARYLWSSGNPSMPGDVLRVVKFHDKETGAHEDRPLA